MSQSTDEPSDYKAACDDPALDSAIRLASLLKSEAVRVALAESCTAGLAAATLGSIPGISEYFCGSVVAYRDETKISLLGVDRAAIEKWSSVSESVAAQMASNVLAKTAEADYAASVTGHVGPDAPAGQDGTVFIGLAWRRDGQVELYQVKLSNLTANGRRPRQAEATACLLNQLYDCICATRS